ncbi:MAG: ABC transporter permease [Candidatus Marinimicrobia bacterium]|nr:ABC transporter permease [Candidatus Neomarinimicrobiota bacterium]
MRGSITTETLRQLRKNKTALFGLFLVAMLIFVGVFAQWVAPYDPYDADLDISLQPPSAQHWLGTDEEGRDVLSRIIYGARISLKVGIIASSLSLFIGAILGLIAGYFRGWPETIIMRFTDVMFGFPALLFMIGITASVQRPSIEVAMLAIGLVSWPGMARIMRAQVLTIVEQEYVTAARSLGYSQLRIVMRHVLPNSLAPVVVAFTMSIAGAVMAEASLSFIGLGAQPPEPSWGSMIAFGRMHLRGEWWISVFPGLAVAVMVIGFNLFGEGLRDALDPTMRGRGK